MKIDFGEYVAMLNEYLKEHPESAARPVYISNGYCTSQDYVQVNRAPYMRRLTGKMARSEPEDVVFLL
jgi:hypothetical protein